MVGELEGNTVEGLNVWPANVGACVEGELLGAGDVGLEVGMLEGLLVGLKVTGLAVGTI